jgi:alkanesulfonate monooxygenase SsuD/methylene tetrahydromethanopterin reductase-like flavin-dependent oxidoreductase (luciferase family)
VGRELGPDRFAYMAMVGVGDTREEGYRRADQICDYVRTSGIVASQFTNPPGFTPFAANVEALKEAGRGTIARQARIRARDGRPFDVKKATIEEFIDAGLAFAGTPDMVLRQIKDFHDHVGGFLHLLIMGQGGYISHADTVANLTLFSREVLPRLAELSSLPAGAEPVTA